MHDYRSHDIKDIPHNRKSVVIKLKKRGICVVTAENESVKSMVFAKVPSHDAEDIYPYTQGVQRVGFFTKPLPKDPLFICRSNGLSAPFCPSVSP